MAAHFDVIVVGVGAMGAAACWEFAKRGVRVLGLEQFDIPHNRGSSHGYSRMTRMAYCEHPDYVPLLRRSNSLWRELEQESGESILHLVGGLYMGPLSGDLVGGSQRSAQQHGLAHELLDHRTLAQRHPQFVLPEDWVGLHEPQAGFLLPELAISSLVTCALRRGAEIHGHEPVLSWKVETGHVTVTTARETYHAEKLVLSGGAWSNRLVSNLGVNLVVTRQTLGWVWPKEGALGFQEAITPVKGTKNMKLVEEYANFTISPEYGEFMARNTRYAPASKAAVDRLEPAFVKDIGIDTSKLSRLVFKEIPPNKPRWEEIWNEVKAA